MLKTNFHTHTYRCKHAGGTEAELVHQALANKLTALGFSEHGPYPNNRFGLRMDYDVIFINDLPWDDYCEKACDLIISYAKVCGITLEFNANGMRRGLKNYCDGTHYPYPHKLFWDKVSTAGVSVPINSDCHNPNQLWDLTMDEAYTLAHHWNLNVIQHI